MRLLTAGLAALALVTAPFGSGADAQPRTRIAVSAFENKVKQPTWDPSWNIGEGLAEMLTTELVKTGRFIVVERQGLSDVVQEQALGQSGLVRKETAAASGQILGAQLVVRGAITEFAAQASGGSVGVQGRSVGLQGGVENGHVALDLRVVDAATGQIVAAHSVSKVVPAGGAGLGARTGSVQFGGDFFFQTPIGQATRAAIQEAVRLVLAAPVSSGPQAYALVKVEAATAYLNAGSSAGVKVGDVFQVYSAGEDLIDPSTGLKLGAAERLLGSIEVTAVEERFSIATIRSGAAAMKRGDRVRPR